MSEDKDRASLDPPSGDAAALPVRDLPASSGEPTPRTEANGISPAGHAEKVQPTATAAPTPKAGGFLSSILGRRPTPTPQPSQQPKHHDVVREVAETVVFVVVLVLLLKTFIAEAFVIPTGSMATTLWGYQKVVECPECGFSFPVNCSSQVDPQTDRVRTDVMGCTCPNCRIPIRFRSPNDPAWNSGDRVLVAKFLYDSGLRKPQRHDVVVFKYPGDADKRGTSMEDGPQKNHVAMNYIKRLIGQSGETIGIHAGKLFFAEGIVYDDQGVPPQDLRLRKNMHENEAAEMLKLDVVRPTGDPAKKFHIIHKRPDVLLALSRPVFDNDFQPRDLAGPPAQRWTADMGWKPDSSAAAKRFTAEAAGENVQWLRYHNLLRGPNNELDPKPQLISDFMGYNTGTTGIPELRSPQNWVGDLLVEAEVQLDKAAKGDELWIELSKGVDRFQARFALDTGHCTLVRKTGRQETVLGEKDTAFKGSGTYNIRLANVDERLTLWVNADLPFDEGVAYDPPKELGPDPEPDPAKNNDLQPASFGVKGAPGLNVAHIKLSRDTYYTANAASSPDQSVSDWSDPRQWGPLRDLPYRTMFVQPAHYLCLGDNSPESSDGRYWGLVPERLLLGRALLVYFPFKPFGNESRVGPIK